MDMGLFSKKPDEEQEVFDDYADAMLLWCQRVNQARDAGADVATTSAIIQAAGQRPRLNIERLASRTDRDAAIAAARVWVGMEADKLARQDVLRGRPADFWKQIGDYLYSDLPQPSY